MRDTHIAYAEIVHKPEEKRSALSHAAYGAETFTVGGNDLAETAELIKQAVCDIIGVDHGTGIKKKELQN